MVIYFKKFIQNEKGSSSIAIFIGSSALVFLLLLFILLTTIAVALFRYVEWEHYEIGATLRYAVFYAEVQQQSSGEDVGSSQSLLDTNQITPIFVSTYLGLTGQTVNPVLQSYNAGGTLPNGVIVDQPGYLATVTLPLLPNGSLLNGAIQSVPITIGSFIPVQPVPGIVTGE